jgi:hypothetical protein
MYGRVPVVVAGSRDHEGCARRGSRRPILSSEPHAYTEKPSERKILALHFAGFNEHFGCRVERLSSDLERALLLSVPVKVRERRSVVESRLRRHFATQSREPLIGSHPRNLELRPLDVLVAESLSRA